jgi:hypothetical protein
MSTKKMIAERIKLRLTGNDPTKDSLYDLRILMMDVDDAFSGLARARYWESREEDKGAVAAAWAVPYIVDIQTDDTRKRKYIDLPSSYLMLPNNQGVWRVTGVEDEAAEVVPCSPGHDSIFDGMEAENLDGRPGYRLEGTRLWLTRNFKLPRYGWDQCIVRLVAGTRGKKENEDLPISSDIETDIVANVVEKYLGRTPKPDQNNNNA